MGSANRNKTKVKLAKVHQRMANIRKDAIHKLTSWLCKNHAVIGLEDLNVSGMMKNHKLAGAVADSALYEIRRQAKYIVISNKNETLSCTIITNNFIYRCTRRGIHSRSL